MTVANITAMERTLRMIESLSLVPSNDNVSPRAKVLQLKRPPRAPRVLYVVTVSVPPDVNDWLCRASGFTAGTTDPDEIDRARARMDSSLRAITEEALIRYARGRNDDGGR